MIFRGITGSNDWTFGQGANSYFTKQAAVAANIKTSLMFFRNDCFWSMTSGIDWKNLLGTKQPAAQANIVLQTRATIAGCEDVVRINSLNATINPVTRRLTLAYVIDTTFSRGVTGFVQTP